MKYLLQHFKTLTKHPQNAEELKDLILRLAIQGNLTANWRNENPNVETATDLLERIKEEKLELISQKKIKKEKPLPQIDNNEEFRKIPHSWKVERLGNIGDWGAGATPLRSRHDFYGGKTNWFKSGELNNAVIDYESSEKITDLALEKTSVRLNKPGDVLIAMYGATIGKTGRLKVYGTTNQAVCACTPFSCITSEYLHLLLKGLKQIFLNQGEGGAQPNISRVKIRNQIFALPPLEEQKAIVAIVNELFEEVEQLEDLTKTRVQLKEDFITSALQRLTQTDNVNQEWRFLQTHFTEFFTEIENVKQLRDSILQLAVQGKLTTKWRSQNPNTEPASELLKRIQTEKQELLAQKKIKKEKPLPQIEDHEKPYDLPEGWAWCRLRDLVTLLGDGIHGTPNYTLNGPVHFVNGNNLDDGVIKIKSNTKTVSEEEAQKHFRLLNDRTVFVSINGTIGNTAFYSGEKIMLGKSACYFNLFEDIDKEYIRQLLKSCYFLNYAFDSATGTTIKNVSLRTMREFIVPLPPLEEQKAIVKQVNSLMALCDSLEEHIENSQAQIEQLMQSCLREVFEDN